MCVSKFSGDPDILGPGLVLLHAIKIGIIFSKLFTRGLTLPKTLNVGLHDSASLFSPILSFLDYYLSKIHHPCFHVFLSLNTNVFYVAKFKL